MKNLVTLCLAAAVASLVLGIASRIILTPLAFGLEANAFLRFTDTCVLFAIVLVLMQMSKAK